MSSAADISTLREQAAEALRQRDFAGSISLYRQAAEQSPGDVAVHQGLAVALFHAGDVEGAIESFRRVAEANPFDGRGFINLGAALNRAGRHTEAVQALQRGLKTFGRSAEGYYNLGIAERKLNQLPMAVSAYREAIRLSPDMAEAHLNLANIHLELGQPAQAIPHYEHALKVQPKFERARVGLEQAMAARREQQRAQATRGVPTPSKSALTNEVHASGRVLSEAERRVDRRRLAELSVGLLHAVNETIQQLRTKLEPNLHAVNRGIAESQRREQLTTLLKNYQMAIRETAEKRRTLEIQLGLLRRHEKAAATPGGLL